MGKSCHIMQCRKVEKPVGGLRRNGLFYAVTRGRMFGCSGFRSGRIFRNIIATHLAQHIQHFIGALREDIDQIVAVLIVIIILMD